MKTKNFKFIGPTKKMIDTLTAEGLSVVWPNVCETEQNLCIEATFYTGSNGYEKIVNIDLRDESNLSTKGDVDIAIAKQLQEVYEAFDIDDEFDINHKASGLSTTDLLEDLQEEERYLGRIAAVAEAISQNLPVPEYDNSDEEIKITVADAKKIIAVLRGCDTDEVTASTRDFLAGNLENLCKAK